MSITALRFNASVTMYEARTCSVRQSVGSSSSESRPAWRWGLPNHPHNAEIKNSWSRNHPHSSLCFHEHRDSFLIGLHGPTHNSWKLSKFNPAEVMSYMKSPKIKSCGKTEPPQTPRNLIKLRGLQENIGASGECVYELQKALHYTKHHVNVCVFCVRKSYATFIFTYI